MPYESSKAISIFVTLRHDEDCKRILAALSDQNDFRKKSKKRLASWHRLNAVRMLKSLCPSFLWFFMPLITV